ncbi:hypothetical protein DUI87_18225 [Hirundo rustica rustica]|uniref:Uncharacterized protein n=1 Tax=Hirundo rustica rustica TaxID=333673 RepID=A0A3M0K1A6_HIRRU|nr:hypothetical protein DUI87_18225 [Hirundo rustica rustica]
MVLLRRKRFEGSKALSCFENDILESFILKDATLGGHLWIPPEKSVAINWKSSEVENRKPAVIPQWKRVTYGAEENANTEKTMTAMLLFAQMHCSLMKAS